MNQDAVRGAMEELTAFPGVAGCAVVDAATGMAWYHAGVLPELERFSEAAVEFWRVQLRLARYFGDLGPPRSAASSFAGGVVALFPCCDDPPLVLVCVTNRKDVPWHSWRGALARLQHAIQNTAAAVPDAAAASVP